MMAATALSQQKVWIDKSVYDRAECLHYERQSKVESNSVGKCDSFVCKISSDNQEIINTNVSNTKTSSKKSKEKKNKADKKNKCTIEVGKNEANKQEQGGQESTCSKVPASGSLANEVAKARQHIKKGLQCVNNISSESHVLSKDISSYAELKRENEELRAIVNQLSNKLSDLTVTVQSLSAQVNGTCTVPQIAVCPAKPPTQASSAPAADNDDDDDDDVDIFGSDSEGESEEAAKIREQRLAAYAAKKSKKPVIVAKSNIIFDIKPWDDETDMEAMEREVRKINLDGLLWGAAKLVPLAYGIKKLQISCVLEDDKVSVDELTELIENNEDLVQSVDIAAFNKI